MDVNCAYLEQEWKYSIFCFGKIKIRFLQDGTIQYRKVLSWKNGGLMVEVQTKYGDRKEYINIAVLLSDLGYDAQQIVSQIDEIRLWRGEIIPDNFFAMYGRGYRQYQVSCPRGSVLFDEKGKYVASSLPDALGEGAYLYFLNEIKMFEERKNNKYLDVQWVDKMADCSTEDYAFFRDGEVYYSVMKVFPEGWCVFTPGGGLIATELSHSETYGAEWALHRCMKLAGVTPRERWTESEKKIHAIADEAEVVKYGIAFLMEETCVRAIPVGWPQEYAVFDLDGKVTESEMHGNRRDRAEAGYAKVKDIWLRR